MKKAHGKELYVINEEIMQQPTLNTEGDYNDI